MGAVKKAVVLRQLTAASDDVLRSVLADAASRGCMALLRYLLHHTPGLKARHLKPAVLEAAQCGRPRCLQLLLNWPPKRRLQRLLMARDGTGSTPLILVSEVGHERCLALLLEHDPERQVAATDVHGVNALMLAADGGHVSCAQRLLCHDPLTQVAAADVHGVNALMLAADGGHVSCAQRLLCHDPLTQVRAACTSRLDIGGFPCPQGTTALMLAADSGARECMELLLRHVPDEQIEAEDEHRHNALVHFSLNFRWPMRLPGSDLVRCLRLLLRYPHRRAMLRSALEDAVAGLQDASDAAAGDCVDGGAAAEAALRECVWLLMAKGARLSRWASVEAKKVVRGVTQDLAERALAPGAMREVVEAAVGLALLVRRSGGQQPEQQQRGQERRQKLQAQQKGRKRRRTVWRGEQ